MIGTNPSGKTRCRSTEKPLARQYIITKRIFDLTLGTLLFFLCAPVMVLVCGLIRYHLGPGIFFRQIRPGLRGRPFRILKFRTMTDARDRDDRLLPDDRRMTDFGRFLRATSLDELPEIINVLLGEMSLVGPRPLLMRYLPRYSKQQARRHEVLPGITGLAQINGRNDMPWTEKFRLDVWYVDHCCLALDIRILLQTVKKVLRREGVHKAGHATTEEFYPHSADTDASADADRCGHQR